MKIVKNKETTKPKAYFVIDGGGSKTQAYIFNEKLQEISSSVAGPSNLHHGIESAWKSVGDCFKLCCQDVRIDPSDYEWTLLAGMAGCRTETRKKFIEQDPIGFVRHVIVTDGHASLLGALGHQSGLMVAIGTGVIALARDNAGDIHRCGGWGFPIDDMGGGAFLGFKAVQAYIHFIEGRTHRKSSIFEGLDQFFEEKNGFQNWVIGAKSTDYASLAPMIISAEAKSDPLAADLFSESAREITGLIHAFDKFDMETDLVLLGGFARFIKPYLPPRMRGRVIPPRMTLEQGILSLSKISEEELIKWH